MNDHDIYKSPQKINEKMINITKSDDVPNTEYNYTSQN